MDDGWHIRLIEAVERAMESGTSAADIARKSNVNRSQVDDLLRKGTRPRVDTFLKLCQGVDADPVEILTGVKQDAYSRKALEVFSTWSEDRKRRFLDWIDAPEM